MRPRFTRTLTVTLLFLSTALTPALAVDAGDWAVTASWSRAADDAFRVTLVAGADAPHAAGNVTFDVAFEGVDGAHAAWTEHAGAAAVAPGVNASFPFTPTRGNGSYVLTVTWDAGAAGRGVASALTLPVGTGGDGRFVLDVADAPTTLAYSSDGVNDAWKAKYPGDALIARFTVEDANGLDTVPRVVASYARVAADGSRVTVNASTFTALDDGDPDVTRADVEARFADAPLAAGDYVENVTAFAADGRVLASVERPFVILDPLPELLDDAFGPALPADRDRVLAATARLADKNLGTGPLDASSVPALGVVTATIYRSSRVVADPGWAVVIGHGDQADPMRLDLSRVGHADGTFPYSTDGAYGVLHVPVRVAVPADAPPGSYRVTIQHAENASAEFRTLGTLPFDVAPQPRVAALDVASVPLPGASLPVNVTLADAPAARVLVTATDATGRVVANASRGNVTQDALVTLTLALPGDVAPGPLTVTARAFALPDSPPPRDGSVAHRALALTVDAGPPTLALAPDAGRVVLAGPRGSGAFTLTALNFTPRAFAFTLTDAAGAVVNVTNRLTAHGDGAFTLDARGLSPGAFTLTARATGADGVIVTASAPARVLPWLGVRLDAAPAVLADAGNGRFVGAIGLAAEGNVPVDRVLVTVGPFPDGRAVTGTVRVVDAAGAARATAVLENGRALLSGDLLAPGEEGPRLEVDVDAVRGLDAGRVDVPVRVLLAPGGGA